MSKEIVNFINKLEGFKTAVKNLHWSSSSLSQHKLFDDVADALADFQDKVSEVYQSIAGRFKLNELKPVEYEISSPQKFLEDVLSATKEYYSHIRDLGDDYIGMRSDCEAYISDLQRSQYLLDFTLKNELKERLRESMKIHGKKIWINEDQMFIQESLDEIKKEKIMNS